MKSRRAPPFVEEKRPERSVASPGPFSSPLSGTREETSITVRVRHARPAAEAVAEAAAGRCPSPGSPIRPGRSASPEAAAEAAAGEAEEAEAAEGPRSYRSGRAEGCVYEPGR